jgi:mRNA-degrading endonuclease toxin of MazEF toxin-antitoxin module
MNSNYIFGTGKFRWTLNENTSERGIPGRLVGIREELDWIRRQIEYMNFSEKFKLRYDLKKGEIYEIDFGLNINTEFSNRHYGVVLKDSNEFDPQVLVCPLKSNHRGPHPRSDIDIGYIKDLHSSNTTLAVINQIRPIDKLRIYTNHKIGNANGLMLAEATNEADSNTIPRLEEKQLELILNSYCNFVFGPEN